MGITGVQGSSTPLQKTNESKITKDKSLTNENTSSGILSDEESVIYTPSNSQEKKTSTKNTTYKVDMTEINKMKAEVDQHTQALRDMVEKLITKQGYKVKDVLSALEQGKEVDIKVDADTQAQAQAEISEDGFWGVKQTSERILDFAKQLAGDDPSKFKALRSAVEDGFKAAEKAFGGKLPDISQKTYDAVMKGFDELEGKTDKADKSGK